ncbi:UBP-type zinc finger domain-containing protein [Rubellimicrobium rubrum]|uniref:UBP-type zinc finger domain-containing protein n=1 Tax=Rubellimicrobium rubrum TaxID=2585369 RepID=A0A5C4MMI7_9RHOB|nr:UBP-type zinc finger domain-containing protein [Rubellimicrobium rubrum]
MSARTQGAVTLPKTCTHRGTIVEVTPSALVCEECLQSGSRGVHLRLCRTCGHVGCRNSSPNRHATVHFRATGHPIIEGYDPPEGWGWCYVNQTEVDVGRPAPQSGPIPRFVRRGMAVRCLGTRRPAQAGCCYRADSLCSVRLAAAAGPSPESVP